MSNSYPTSISVRTQTGRYVTTIQTDSRGRFRTVLRPGRYTLTPYGSVITLPPGTLWSSRPYTNPVEVVVPRGRFVPVTFTYRNSELFQ